ncbi:MAG: hypothetical protein NUV53_04445 [Patescibacteria group bacterium]|nr:hypothetical protein [Patescibacteria group bacterium]
MKNTKLQNYFEMFLPYFLFAQGANVLYKMIPSLFTHYRAEVIFLVPWGSAMIGGILALLAGIGILLRKRWGIISYFVFILFPIAMTFFGFRAFGFTQSLSLPIIGEGWLIILNIILALLLSFSAWKKRPGV